MVGCFNLSRKRSPLKKSPQSPDTVDTKFWMYTRQSTIDILPLPVEQLLNLRNVSERIEYNDNGSSLLKSSFDPSKPLKVLIHGFKGSGRDKGALGGVQAFLQLEDVNVLVVDWTKGAGDSYPTAAANTELIGRQTAVVLLDMVKSGVKPYQVHVIGFSLGAHIAGCAGNMLKAKGFTLGRITGLDPASPFFKHQFVRESSTKLDASDADFVDIIHTDGSPVFTDGFGILRPIGHVDFFPNGGREQPGCSDGRGSVVVSTLEGTINSSVACSHVRAWELFLESSINLHKENGEQLQAHVRVAERTQQTRGYLHMQISHSNRSTNFQFNNELADAIDGGVPFSALAVAERGTMEGRYSQILSSILSFQSLEFQNGRPNVDIHIGEVRIRDTRGGVWSSCRHAGKMIYLPDSSFSTLPVNLTREPCF